MILLIIIIIIMILFPVKEAEKIEQQLNNLTKKFQSMESQFDVVIEDLFNASIKLEEKEKVNHKQLDTRAE